MRRTMKRAAGRAVHESKRAASRAIDESKRAASRAIDESKRAASRAVDESKRAASRAVDESELALRRAERVVRSPGGRSAMVATTLLALGVGGVVLVRRRRATARAAASRASDAIPGGPAGQDPTTGEAAAGKARARDRWHSVTINRTPEEVGSLPEPLAGLGSTIDVRVRPAPGGRGTELSARLHGEVPTGMRKVAARLTGDDPVRHLRRALRETKQSSEVGEVILPDAPATTRQTLTSRPLTYATRHGRDAGRL